MTPKPMYIFPNPHYSRARLYLILQIRTKKINCFTIAMKILIAKIRKITLTVISRLVKTGRDVKIIKKNWTRQMDKEKQYSHRSSHVLSIFIHGKKQSHGNNTAYVFIMDVSNYTSLLLSTHLNWSGYRYKAI